MGPLIAPRRPTPADMPRAVARTRGGWLVAVNAYTSTWEENTKHPVRNTMT